MAASVDRERGVDLKYGGLYETQSTLGRRE